MTPAPILPRLLGEAQAAAYLGVSPGTLRKLGVQRRALLTRRLYDRLDLDRVADGLPYEGDTDEDQAACDKAFQ